MPKKQLAVGAVVALVLTIGMAVGGYLVSQRQQIGKKAQAANTFTVEALLGSTRFTQVNARAIIRYDVTPRVDYQNCMTSGYMSLPLQAGGSPCTGVSAGSYATKWDRQVTAGGQTYKLVYPTTCVGEKIGGVEVCEQTENIQVGVGAPYHRGIYQLLAAASPTPTPTPTPLPAQAGTPTPTPRATPTPTPRPSPSAPAGTAPPTPTPLSALPQTGGTGTWAVAGAGAALLLPGSLLILAL